MFKSIHFFLAKRYIFTKKKEESFVSITAWFSFIGIMLGVAVLIVVMSVMNGFRKEIVGRLIGVNGHIMVQDNSNNIEYKQNILKINNLEDVDFALPLIQKQVLASSNTSSNGALVKGLKVEDLIKIKTLSASLLKPTLASFNNNEGIIIGRVMARNLNLTKGSTLTLINPKGYSTIAGFAPKISSFKVVGVFNTKMFEYDNSLILMPFNQAIEFFNLPNNGKVGNIEIFLHNADNSFKNAPEISKILNNKPSVYTWQEANGAFINALDVERNVMFMILSLLIIIAAFNIISGMVMLVNTKKKDIAILRAYGLYKKDIAKIFLIVSSFIGFIGTFLGALLGTLFAVNIQQIRSFLEGLFGGNLFPEEIYFLSQLPVSINNTQIVFIILFSLVLTVLASLYPCYKASKIEPAEALKQE